MPTSATPNAPHARTEARTANTRGLVHEVRKYRSDSSRRVLVRMGEDEFELPMRALTVTAVQS